MTAKKQSTRKSNYQDRLVTIVKRPFICIHNSSKQYLARRPHRSLRLTRRRDYARSLKLPGYWAFGAQVRRTLWANKKLFIWLVIVYAILTALLVGMASQDAYSTLTDTLRQAGGDVFSGNWGEIDTAGLLFMSAVTGGVSTTLSEVQQIYSGLIFLLTWLTTVWLLRNILAGHKVKLRDGLYNASAPLLSTFLITLILIVQLLPLAIALIGYAAALASGLLSGGITAMLFWIAAGLLVLLSLYWISSTFIALVVVALPGMYPLDALRTAGDLVTGRRIRILLRLLWLGLEIVIIWALIMIPVILLDTWLKGLWSAIEWLPAIPFALLVMSSLTIVWASSYIYLLYRKVVADDAAPA
jgi:hypothetical protein